MTNLGFCRCLEVLLHSFGHSVAICGLSGDLPRLPQEKVHRGGCVLGSLQVGKSRCCGAVENVTFAADVHPDRMYLEVS